MPQYRQPANKTEKQKKKPSYAQSPCPEPFVTPGDIPVDDP
jgi:hypothetical protein